MFASHSWPRWGNERIQAVMRAQRDLYAFLNNQVLHLANQGVTINEIQNVYEPPEEPAAAVAGAQLPRLATSTTAARVINRYLGYWDANPATLIPLSPADSAPLYVEMMGGAEKILAKGQQLYDTGRYRLARRSWTSWFTPSRTMSARRDLLADVFEQIGYQQESPSVRNSFLAAAYELRTGVPEGQTARTAGADFVRAMTTDMFLDYTAIRLDTKKAGTDEFTINLVTPDNGEKYVVELSNGVLTNVEGYQAKQADLTLSLDRAELDRIILGQVKLAELVEAGSAKAEGDITAMERLFSYQIDFDLRFQMVPGAGEPPKVTPTANPFEQ